MVCAQDCAVDISPYKRTNYALFLTCIRMISLVSNSTEMTVLIIENEQIMLVSSFHLSPIFIVTNP